MVSRLPWARISPPWRPAPRPEVDNAVGRARMVSGSCSTTRRELPLARRAASDCRRRGVVACVEADGGLVEHIEDPGKVAPELSREADALRLTAREGVGGTVQREVIKADFVHEVEALANLRQKPPPKTAVPRWSKRRLPSASRRACWCKGEAFQRCSGRVPSWKSKYTARAVSFRRVPSQAGQGSPSPTSSGHVLEALVAVHPVEDRPVTPADRTPPARGIPGKALWIEFGKGFAGHRIGAAGGKTRWSPPCRGRRGSRRPCPHAERARPLPAKGTSTPASSMAKPFFFGQISARATSTSCSR